jgi:beta-mannosidase
VANDGPSRLQATLRVSLYRDLETEVGSAQELLDLPARTTVERNVEALIGHFVDASWAYRFGPPAQDVIVVTLEDGTDEGAGPISQSFRFPSGRPMAVESAERLGLEGVASASGGGLRLEVGSRRLAYQLRLLVPGFAPTDDAFSVEPGGRRTVALLPLEAGALFRGGGIRALNLDGTLAVRWEGPPP